MEIYAFAFLIETGTALAPSPFIVKRTSRESANLTINDFHDGKRRFIGFLRSIESGPSPRIELNQDGLIYFNLPGRKSFGAIWSKIGTVSPNWQSFRFLEKIHSHFPLKLYFAPEYVFYLHFCGWHAFAQKDWTLKTRKGETQARYSVSNRDRFAYSEHPTCYEWSELVRTLEPAVPFPTIGHATPGGFPFTDISGQWQRRVLRFDFPAPRFRLRVLMRLRRRLRKLSPEGRKLCFISPLAPAGIKWIRRDLFFSSLIRMLNEMIKALFGSYGRRCPPDTT